MLVILKPVTAVILLSSFVYSFISNTVNAACKGIDCACTPSELNFASPTGEPNEDGLYATSLEADDVQAQGDDLVELTGNAQVQQGRQTIVADNLKYYRQSERVVATGAVELISEKGDYLSSDSIDVFADTQIGTLLNSEFKLAKSLKSEDGIDTVQVQSRGSADVVNLEGEGVVLLENAMYSNCPDGNDSVLIKAREMELDRIGGVGRAKGATLRFKGVPIFYTPYISFPLNDQRKTGFLVPGFGSDGDSGGIIDAPWYWNIAKNQDATFTPRYYSNRGLQVLGEYRHESLTSSTQINAEFLPDDDLFGDDRSSISVRHIQEFTDNLSGSINYNDVSDVDYYTDLRSEYRFFSAIYVPRDARLNYKHDLFSLGVRANQYQAVDDRIIRTPYERLPSISFRSNLPKGPYDMKYGVDASYINFASDTRADEGKRLAVTPYVEIPFENVWGYVKPRLSLHHRSYSLQRENQALDDSPSFNVPVLSVDSGIFFERNSSWFGESAIQTLEPRLFYVYAPKEDQDEAPIFDTSRIRFNNYGNGFRETRFFGSDRVGDDNRVTIGATTRIIDSESGRGRLKFSMGQSFLLDDQEQNLFPGQIVEKGLGDLFLELKTRSKDTWRTSSFVQYSHEEDDAIRTARFSFGYNPSEDSRKDLSFGYYFLENGDFDIKQITYDVQWPISDRWQVFGQGNYSLGQFDNVSSTVGVEYNGCCWKLRVMGSDRIDPRRLRLLENGATDDQRRASLFIELELTSLGRFSTGF